MENRIISITLVLSLLASLLPAPLFAQSPAEDDRPALQGEIAYVHDGDIWLLRPTVFIPSAALPAGGPAFCVGYGLRSEDLKPAPPTPGRTVEAITR